MTWILGRLLFWTDLRKEKQPEFRLDIYDFFEKRVELHERDGLTGSHKEGKGARCQPPPTPSCYWICYKTAIKLGMSAHICKKYPSPLLGCVAPFRKSSLRRWSLGWRCSVHVTTASSLKSVSDERASLELLSSGSLYILEPLCFVWSWHFPRASSAHTFIHSHAGIDMFVRRSWAWILSSSAQVWDRRAIPSPAQDTTI